MQLSFSDRSSVELDSDEYSMRHPGDDPSETFALREYVPGDRVRSIHWKLTEKTGEVIVRQLGLRSIIPFYCSWTTACPRPAPRRTARRWAS